MCHIDINLNIAPPHHEGRGFRYGEMFDEKIFPSTFFYCKVTLKKNLVIYIIIDPSSNNAARFFDFFKESDMRYTNVEMAEKFLVEKTGLDQPSVESIGELADKLGQSPIDSVVLIPGTVDSFIMGYNIYKKIQDGSWEFIEDI